VLRWTVIVPVKGLGSAKSRLSPDGSAVALAFLADVLTAVRECTIVADAVVATHDPTVAALAREHGADVCEDRAHPGINAAARFAAQGRSGPIAVLVSDLPCLTADDLAAVLQDAVDHERAFVRDADGTGTTMLLALTAGDLDPHFGPGSAAAHAATGAVDLTETGDFPRARRDVDTVEALADAVALGVGPATRAALAAPAT
jgi:2-phospho-L-lactate guanylyltransferase